MGGGFAMACAFKAFLFADHHVCLRLSKTKTANEITVECPDRRVERIYRCRCKVARPGVSRRETTCRDQRQIRQIEDNEGSCLCLLLVGLSGGEAIDNGRQGTARQRSSDRDPGGAAVAKSRGKDTHS